jgi:hypothetical protein
VFADLAELIHVLKPRVIVTGVGPGDISTLREEADCPLIALVGLTRSLDKAVAVSVRWQASSDGDAATVQGSRIAAGLGIPIELVSEPGGSKRLEAVRRGLSERGVQLVSGVRRHDAFRLGTSIDGSVNAVVVAESDMVPVDWRTVDLGQVAAPQRP